MKKCFYCNNLISKSETVCPICGTKQLNWAWHFIKRLFLVVIFIIAVIIGACVGASIGDYKTVDNANTTTTAESKEPEKNELSGLLNAIRVSYISDRMIQTNENGDLSLFFSLSDSLRNAVKVPAAVDIKIVNDNNETVYEATQNIDNDDFGYWENAIGIEMLLANINIKSDDIQKGTIGSGKIVFKVYDKEGYWEFEESEHIIYNNLPVLPADVTLPDVPITLNRNGYDKTITSTCVLSNITYTESFDFFSNITFVVEGEKTYDKEGNDNNDICAFNYKITDGDGYVIDSGAMFTSSLSVGEKFKEKIICYSDEIKPGGVYELKLSDYN